jgi:hypothetical protein
MSLRRLLESRRKPDRGTPARQEPEPETDSGLTGLLRLPRFDRAMLRKAAGRSTQRQYREKEAGDVQYVLRDGEHDILEIVAKTSIDPVNRTVLPITVFTEGLSTDYLMLFQAQGPGEWAAALDVPGVLEWADSGVHERREARSLDGRDVPAVKRSVLAAPELWVPAWQAVKLARANGDPVRVAIEEALRS